MREEIPSERILRPRLYVRRALHEQEVIVATCLVALPEAKTGQVETPGRHTLALLQATRSSGGFRSGPSRSSAPAPKKKNNIIKYDHK